MLLEKIYMEINWT